MFHCKNYRGISLLSVVGKIYARILVDRVRKMTECLIEDEQGRFKVRRCVDQIGEKHRRKNVVNVGFMDLEKGYDRVNRKAQWQVLRM